MLNSYDLVGDAVMIHLRGGLVCWIELSDLPLVSAFPRSWQPFTVGPKIYAKGWPAKGVPPIYMHRLLMGFPPWDVDHLDHDGLNNRRTTNLRLASKSLNGIHRKACSKNNKLGVRGVVRTRSGKYLARVTRDGVAVLRRIFPDLATAEQAVRSIVEEITR